jgi:hypothetical protein
MTDAPSERFLTELGSPADLSLVVELETSEVTDALLDTLGMRSFFEVWRKACAARGRSLPARADVDILELTTYIGELGLLEVVEGGRDFRYRVHSTGAAKLLGQDYTGKLLSATNRPAERLQRLVERYRRVVATKVPWYSRTPADAEIGIAYTARLLLPLSEDGERVSMIIFARQSGPRRPAR